jgi:hypothetical protein
MALFQALNSNNAAPLRLMAMTTIPTTEDLLYALATAKQNKRPVELPFKNVYNKLDFIVRVAPGVPGTPQVHPRWTFERCDGNGPGGQNTWLWMRETSEVMMVQGKIKIEVNYGGQKAEAEETVETQAVSGSVPIIMGGSSAITSTGANPAVSAANLPAMSQRQDLEPASVTTSGTWLFHEGGRPPVFKREMPPPVALNQDLIKNYLDALSNPATNLLRHSAFEFLLLRDCKAAKKNSTPYSLLVFDFIDQMADADGEASVLAPVLDPALDPGPDPALDQVLALDNVLRQTLAEFLSSICTPLELYTQLRTGEYAVSLNGYDCSEALLFAEKLCLELSQGSANLGPCKQPGSVAIGVASIPEICNDPGTLVAAAIKAKELARQAKQSFMPFPMF